MVSSEPLPQLTCVVLAGGRSARMGHDKAFLDIGGRPMIEWVLERLAGLGQETIIVANAPERYAYLGYPIVTDLLPDRGALGGLYTGLYYAQSERVLVVGCDMPFLNRALLCYQAELSRHFDVVVPRIGEWMEPLHSIYARACLGPIKALLDRGGYRIWDFYQDVRVRYVEAAEIERFDPQHLSFLNVNTPADLETVRQWAAHYLAEQEEDHAEHFLCQRQNGN